MHTFGMLHRLQSRSKRASTLTDGGTSVRISQILKCSRLSMPSPEIRSRSWESDWLEKFRLAFGTSAL